MLWQERVFALLESISIVEPMPGNTAAEFVDDDGNEFKGVAFELQNVTFAYPTLVEHNVLRRLCLSIPAGKTVALVGERGIKENAAALALIAVIESGKLAAGLMRQWPIGLFAGA